MNLPNFLTGNNPQKYQLYIRTAKVLFQCTTIFKNIEDVDVEQMGSRTLDNSRLTNEIFFLSKIEKGLPLFRAISQHF